MKVTNLTHLGLGELEDGNRVERVLPNEEVDLSSGQPRILSPSPHRVKPSCPHFKSCGGCRMQHASDTFVEDWKVDIVRKAMAARGLDFPLRNVSTSPPRSRRRAKLTARRTKGGAVIGFHSRASDTVVDTPNCILLSPALTDIRPALEELTRLSASRKAEVAFTVIDSPAGVDVMIETERALTQELRIEAAEIASAHALARLTWNDETILTLSAPQQKFGPGYVTPPPGSFLQATREGQSTLTNTVLDASSGAKKILELFAGCGTFTLPLATLAPVHAVEGSAELLDALHHGWRHSQGVRHITVEQRDLFRRPFEPDEIASFDTVVLDPPRAGAEAQMASLAASTVQNVVMVSCNPVTFARDAQTLTEAGFRLTLIDIVDQFRWSAHVEVVAHFTRM